MLPAGLESLLGDEDIAILRCGSTSREKLVRTSPTICLPNVSGEDAVAVALAGLRGRREWPSSLFGVQGWLRPSRTPRAGPSLWETSTSTSLGQLSSTCRRGQGRRRRGQQCRAAHGRRGGDHGEGLRDRLGHGRAQRRTGRWRRRPATAHSGQRANAVIGELAVQWGALGQGRAPWSGEPRNRGARARGPMPRRSRSPRLSTRRSLKANRPIRLRRRPRQRPDRCRGSGRQNPVRR